MTTNSRGQTDPSKQAPISRATKLACWVFPVTDKELEVSEKIDHRYVRSVAWSLILFFVWATMGVTIGLTISLGHFSWYMLGFAIVVGLIVFNIDRSMACDKVKQDGLRGAKRRGAQCAEPDAWPKNLLRILFRFSFALIFALLIGEIYAKKFLEPDIVAHIYEVNQDKNEPVFADAVKIADAEIQAVRDAIVVLDSRAESILTQKASEIEAAQATLKARRDALTSERQELLKEYQRLSDRYLCAQKNLIAEEFGGTRCDGTTARPGKGPKYKTAANLANELDRERKAVKERIDEIDGLLTQLKQEASSPLGSIGSQDALLTSLSTQRAAASASLDDLLKNRDARIRAIAEADPEYEPLRDGIIQRGEALIALAKDSSWALLTIALISSFMFVLDLGAVLGMTITPAPENIAFERAMASEAASAKISAKHSAELADEAETELAAQERLLAATDRIDELKSKARVEAALRRAGEDLIYRDIKEGFDSDKKSGPTIH